MNPGRNTIPEIQQGLQAVEKEVIDYCTFLQEEEFFRQYGEQWSAAQQVKHLVIATKAATLAFSIPWFIVKRIGGIANRPSRTYDELVAKYKFKLGQGGKAGKKYTPAPILPGYGKQNLLNEFGKAMQKITRLIVKRATEDKLDYYVVPHPLLGKITLRELCYFTHLHTLHHLKSIRERISG